MMLVALDPKKKLEGPPKSMYDYQVGKSGEIRVGCCVLCGAPYARTFGQDWWRTTPVKKITRVVYEGKDPIEVRFRTVNGSDYIVRSI